MAVTYLAVRFKGGGTRISAPLLEDGCMKSSSGIAGDTSVALLFVHTGDNYSNETVGLHYTMTLHTLFSRIFEILHVFCLSPSSRYGFKSSSGRVQVVQENLLYQCYHTTDGFKSVSLYTAQQQVARPAMGSKVEGPKNLSATVGKQVYGK